MSSRPSLRTLKTKLRALSRKHAAAQDMKSIVEEMMRERNDRGTALIGAAVIDMLLADLLHLHFLHLSPDETAELFTKENAPLSTLSAKTKLAYALGLLTQQERDEIDIIRSIRNAFAHTSQAISFETEIVRQTCDYLQFSIFDQSIPDNLKTPRMKFVRATAKLCRVVSDQESHLKRVSGLEQTRRSTAS